MDKKRIVTEISYYEALLEKEEKTNIVYENINTFLENIWDEEILSLDDEVNKRIVSFIDLLEQKEDLKLYKEQYSFLWKVVGVNHTFLELISSLVKEKEKSIELIDAFIEENHSFFPIFHRAFLTLQEKIYKAFLEDGDLYLKKYFDEVKPIPLTLLLFYMMQKRKLYDLNEKYLSFYTPIKGTICITNDLIDKFDIDGCDNQIILKNIFYLFLIHEGLLKNGGIKKKYPDAKCDLCIKKMKEALSLHHGLCRYDYCVKRFAFLEVLHDIKAIDTKYFNSCNSIILNLLEKDTKLFYQEKMGIRLVNRVKEDIEVLTKATSHNKKLQQMLYRILNDMQDNGNFALNDLEIRKAILILVIEYVNERMHGKAHQNLIKDCLSLDSNSLVEKYKNKSNVLKELINVVKKEYTKMDILLEIEKMDKKDNLKLKMEELLNDDLKLYNLKDLDIFFDVVVKCYSYYIEHKDSYLRDFPSVSIMSFFDKGQDVTCLDEILDFIASPFFSKEYECISFSDEVKVYPIINDIFKEYRLVVSHISSSYVKGSE